MFDWLFKRSSQDSQESQGFIEPKLNNGQGTATNEQAQLEKTEQELIQIRDTLAQMLPSMGEKVAQLQVQVDEAKAHEISLAELHDLQLQELQQEVEKYFLENQNLHQKIASNTHPLENFEEKTRDSTKLDSITEERDLLLIQMHQLQQEVEEGFLDRQKLKQDNRAFQIKLDKIVQNYPNYIQFESLAITSIDGLSATPGISWKLSDCYFAGNSFSYIEFKSVMHEGKAGIQILSMAEIDSNPVSFDSNNLVYPELASKSTQQQSLLLRTDSKQWFALRAAISTIELVIEKKWQNLILPAEFDRQFWTSCFGNLIKDFRRLPPALRFDRARLKRETVNSDYEHLWLEIFGVTFENITLPKIEIRLSAANITPGKFSRFPKIEIPLIDGKEKPFESWFQESTDDYGGKWELRFDLDNQTFDLNIWSKLSAWDRAFFYGLLGASQIALLQLSKNQITIHRPWKEWAQFVMEANSILRSYLFGKPSHLAKSPLSDDQITNLKQEGVNVNLLVSESSENIKLSNSSSVDKNAKIKKTSIKTGRPKK